MPFWAVSENGKKGISDWYVFLYNLHSNNAREEGGGDYLIDPQHNSKTELCYGAMKFWNFPNIYSEKGHTVLGYRKLTWFS